VRALARVVGVLCVAAVAVPATALPAGAAADIDFDASLAGRPIASATSDDPIVLDPAEPIPLTMTIVNEGDEPASIRFVRLEGEALGLTFLTYDLGVRLDLGPGETYDLDVPLDFFDLESQATGYLGTSLRVYDTERDVIAEERFVVDVRGKATSTLGLFAIVVLIVAALSLVLLVVNTVRRRLPANRFVRGLQFAVAGAAVGLTLSLGMSILRLTYADVEAWVPLVFLPTVIAFGLGYVAPGPLSRSIEEVLEEEELDLAAEEAVARASGRYTAAQSGSFARESGDVRTSRDSGGRRTTRDEVRARLLRDSGGRRTTRGGRRRTRDSGGARPTRDSGSLAPHTSGEMAPHPSDELAPHSSGEFLPGRDTGGQSPPT
jgi:hypothetical protein